MTEQAQDIINICEEGFRAAKTGNKEGILAAADKLTEAQDVKDLTLLQQQRLEELKGTAGSYFNSLERHGAKSVLEASLGKLRDKAAQV